MKKITVVLLVITIFCSYISTNVQAKEVESKNSRLEENENIDVEKEFLDNLNNGNYKDAFSISHEMINESTMKEATDILINVYKEDFKQSNYDNYIEILNSLIFNEFDYLDSNQYKYLISISENIENLLVDYSEKMLFENLTIEQKKELSLEVSRLLEMKVLHLSVTYITTESIAKLEKDSGFELYSMGVRGIELESLVSLGNGEYEIVFHTLVDATLNGNDLIEGFTQNAQARIVGSYGGKINDLKSNYRVIKGLYYNFSNDYNVIKIPKQRELLGSLFGNDLFKVIWNEENITVGTGFYDMHSLSLLNDWSNEGISCFIDEEELEIIHSLWNEESPSNDYVRNLSEKSYANCISVIYGGFIIGETISIEEFLSSIKMIDQVYNLYYQDNGVNIYDASIIIKFKFADQEIDIHGVKVE